MELDAETSEALNLWLAADTWHTTDSNDMDRFYDFVNHYHREHGNTIDEAALREEIERRIKNSGGNISDELRDTIRTRINLAYDILEFLRRTER